MVSRQRWADYNTSCKTSWPPGSGWCGDGLPCFPGCPAQFPLLTAAGSLTSGVASALKADTCDP
eukprot:SM000001S04749  [mRNA]  locus=s1:1973165:1974975:+ [translate_table: standard]